MTMPYGLCASELTTEERCEHLLGIIACTLTGRRPHDLMPWVRRGINEFMQEVGGG